RTRRYWIVSQGVARFVLTLHLARINEEDIMHERMMDRSTRPSDEDMVTWIGQPMAEEWVSLRRFLAETYEIVPVLDAGGKRYGWNLQYRVGARPLCELYPEQG